MTEPAFLVPPPLVRCALIMQTGVNQFLTIARMTALEASRQPIFLLLTTSVVLFIGLLPLTITHVIGDSARIVRDSALALQLVSGLILACFAATSTITRELRKGTLASIISKPIPRALFFLAKFAGVVAIMFTYALTTTLATMLATRTAAIPFFHDWWGVGPLFAALLLAYLWSGLQNFLRQIPFVSRAYLTLSLGVIAAFIVSACMPAAHGEPAIPWPVFPAGLLIGFAMILICAFAVSLATRLEMVPTLSICLGIFLAGLMSDYFFGARAATSAGYATLYALLPNWQHYWAVDALHGGGIPWIYTAGVAAYTVLYGVAILAAGLWTFNNMEVK